MAASNNSFSVFSKNEIKHDVLASQPIMSKADAISTIGAGKSIGF
jgi:hypothetical protein